MSQKFKQRKLTGKTIKPLKADYLAKLVNGYQLKISGATKTIVIPHATELANFQDITVDGNLLPKQSISRSSASKNPVVVSKKPGTYKVEANDGDLHFGLGAKAGLPHVACELQNAKAWLTKFNAALNKSISVSGFFRCMFEHPGFQKNDDAHIFEIHPVRAVSLGGHINSFNVDTPDQKAIHTWLKPNDLNKSDKMVKVKYDKGKDDLTFTGMKGWDENYVGVAGNISRINLNSNGQNPASFTFSGGGIDHPLQAFCLQGTTAATQLLKLSRAKQTIVKMVALRNIDLPQALKGVYSINLLTIDIH